MANIEPLQLHWLTSISGGNEEYYYLFEIARLDGDEYQRLRSFRVFPSSNEQLSSFIGGNGLTEWVTNPPGLRATFNGAQFELNVG